MRQQVADPSTGVRARYRAWRPVVPGEASNRLGLAVVAIGLVVFFSLRSSTFFTTENGLTIAMAMTSVLIVGIGTAALLISGNVDVSIGSMYALVAVGVAQVAVTTGSTLAAVIAGPLFGAVLGGLNGVLVRIMKLSPLIVTIGTLAVFQGLAFVLSDGVPVFGFPSSFLELGRAGFGDLTVPIIVALVTFVMGAFWLVRTRTGLRVYAIGGDERAAALNGVAVSRTVIGLFALNGLLVGIAAVLLAARLGSVSPQFGTQFVFDVLTAVILGGVAFSGGAGRPIGVFIGVATIGILTSGLLFVGLADYWQQIAKGSVLLLALAADQVLQRVRDAGGWRQWLSRQAFVRSEEAHPAGRRIAAEGGRVGTGRFERLQRATPSVEDRPVVLEASGLTRHFGAVHALRDASISVRAGEVLCLLGDNGAGKSTLIKILSGAVRPDGGEIRLDGKEVDLSSPRAARDAGIETVYQDLALCPPLSVAHNLVLGKEPTRKLLGLIPIRDEGAAEAIARRRLAELGIALRDYRVAAQRLSGGQRQAVAIARAVHDDVRVMILDEPTAALGVTQTRSVLELVRSVADRGTAVILITHDIETVLAVADRVIVLRLGSIAHEGPVEGLDEIALVQLMAGLEVERPGAGDDAGAPGRVDQPALPRR
jgi:ribose/xylose/arabinose/galactoside ABC-type transport system permease subunit/ABC-type branched-subunit amino acid transport system ATPase component